MLLFHATRLVGAAAAVLMLGTVMRHLEEGADSLMRAALALRDHV
jgi:hypothetical protein